MMHAVVHVVMRGSRFHGPVPAEDSRGSNKTGQDVAQVGTMQPLPTPMSRGLRVTSQAEGNRKHHRIYRTRGYRHKTALPTNEPCHQASHTAQAPLASAQVLLCLVALGQTVLASQHQTRRAFALSRQGYPVELLQASLIHRRTPRTSRSWTWHGVT